MNIHHQKFPTPTTADSNATSAIKKHQRIDVIMQPCTCACAFKINLLGEQIARINQKISIIVRLMEIPSFKIEGPHSLDAHLKNQAPSEDQNQFLDQSFLLEGIEGSTGVGSKTRHNPDHSSRFNLLVGKEIAYLKDKMRDLQQKSQQVLKLRSNFSLLTKIVEKIEDRVESDSTIPKPTSVQEVMKSKTYSNESAEEHDKKNSRVASSMKKAKEEKSTKPTASLGESEARKRTQ